MMLQPEAVFSPHSEVVYRQGTPEDMRAVHRVFRYAIADLSYRLGLSDTDAMPDDDALQAHWELHHKLFKHLTNSADHFWVAEHDGDIIGFARSIRRGSLRELTEFFVLPGEQSAGVGKELLRRAFPPDGVEHRSIIATTDVRAQARYLKVGVYPRFPIYIFSRQPEILPYHPNLSVEPLSTRPETLDTLGRIDEAVLGHRRDADHRWLLSSREGWLYTMNQRVIGYGYVGKFSGPFALVDASHFPTVLAHAETESALQGNEIFTLGVPTVNATAVQYLLGRGYRISPFFCHFMSDNLFGQFENYIGTAPMLLL